MRVVTSLVFFLISSSVMKFEYLLVNSRRTSVVQTPSGPVRGTVLRTVWNGTKYSAFKGIPYAKPPIGDLRFKPPVPIEPWRKLLNAYQEGNVCPQLDEMSNEVIGQEDCLYLNVFTRERGFKNRLNLRPVMVWIHGGAYQTGYSNSSLYGPDFFLEEDVVFVSFNYRLGVFGFLALNHSDATGNAGLKDQNLVLRWVQSNIAAFGGDPKQVTIFGESAGSTSVGFHVLSEKSRGLFLRSISMSGTPLCPWAYFTPEEMIANARQLASILGIVHANNDHLLNRLRETPAAKLVEATLQVSSDFLPFRPTIENPSVDHTNSTFLTECPITKYHNGDFYHHPMMLGFTHNETILFLSSSMEMRNTIAWVKNYLKNIITRYHNIPADLTNHVTRQISSINCGNFETLTKLAMKIFFSGPIDLTQRLLSKNNSDFPIYYYRLSYQTKYSMHRLENIPLNGTAHFDDVGYIFNAKSLHAPTDPNDTFNQFRKKMVSLWANFAKYGNPTPRNSCRSAYDVTWINSVNHGFQLDINSNLTMYTRLIDKDTKIYEKYLNSLLPLICSYVHKSVNCTNTF
ncbi:Venom carboxylesterase-6 [Anthophora plagiata]